MFFYKGLKKTHSKVTSNNKKITFTDFNIIATEISEIEDEISEGKKRGLEGGLFGTNILLTNKMPLTVYKKKISIIKALASKMDCHKFLVDQECMEKYIITIDRTARAEKYR